MAELTPGRRSVAAALLFLLAAVLAGVVPGARGTEYRAFGMMEGLLAMLLTYLLLDRGVWYRPPQWHGCIAIGYAVLANAQILSLLLPPPGVVQWISVIGFLFLLIAGLAVGSPQRLVGLLAGASVLLALLKFSVIPFLWDRSGPGPGEAFGLGSGLDRIRRVVVDHQPVSPEAELLGVAAVALWVLATRVLWAEDTRTSGRAAGAAQHLPVADLPRHDVER